MTAHQQQEKQKLLVLIGPTAVGKTRFSLEIARKFGCEIISGDSMQVYRGMDIGTAKASPEELQSVPHHLIDIREPDVPFSVSDFHELAKQAIREISGRGRLPFIVGGTGLYVESVCYEYEFSDCGSDEDFREQQRKYAAQFGHEALHLKLAEQDPESAQRLHPNDQRRIIRALEVLHLTGETLSAQLARQQKTSPYQLCIVGLTMDRDLLYKRVEARVDQMLEQGLVEEVARLLEKGYDRGLISMQGLGYKEIISYLQGETTLDEAIALLKRDTRRFAKRQLSWFRHMKDIEWVDVTVEVKFSAHLEQISDIISTKLQLEGKSADLL
ncbi:tRNA (adenosine(37)-N6)-dimethylallyltransferase MiaA [Ferviditalea candida]|uniref:tRNA dimethylallyltransferase n=1 Tax=Ferviditalea candida TaxID=3108399 RepID=A0ABU5ZKF7_9BACL|nr:tRNA (adenosine(37)-N6)-dimethylallyltransferase MiaA [Paenibacillaceae bacterium T2]